MNLKRITGLDLTNVFDGFRLLQTIDNKVTLPVVQRVCIVRNLEIVPAYTVGIYIVESRAYPDGLLATNKAPEMLEPEVEMSVVLGRLQVNELPKTNMVTMSRTTIFAVGYLEANIKRAVE